ncbi:hypothetical protein HDA44_000907 [Kribbella solani]|uniref:Uncharacterized protein n=1 Tax=Kribbella solani TaxID=236067 RepID=A0A841DLB6_9ACTN|nr:hypothetical protein [Kribbella solani]
MSVGGEESGNARHGNRASPVNYTKWDFRPMGGK